MGKFIEFDCELFSKPAKCRIRAELISYVGPAHVEGKTAVGYGSETIIVNGTPAEVLALIEAAEGAAVEPVAVRPATMRVEDLREGDVLEILSRTGSDSITKLYFFHFVDTYDNYVFSGERFRREILADYLARGVIVARNGKVISGWPVGEPGGAT